MTFDSENLRTAASCLRRCNKGFTLLEIVIILVVLGILSSVAAYKYFDSTELAHLRVARHAVAVAQSRINSAFAQRILQGEACPAARSALSNLKAISDDPKNASEGSRFGEVYLRPNILTINGSTPMFAKDLPALEVSLTLPNCGEANESINHGMFTTAFNTLMDDAAARDSLTGLAKHGAVESTATIGTRLRDTVFAPLVASLGFDIDHCEAGIYGLGDGTYKLYIVNGRYDTADRKGSIHDMAIDTLKTGDMIYGNGSVDRNTTYATVQANAYLINTDGTLTVEGQENVYAWIRNSSVKQLKFSPIGANPKH